MSADAIVLARVLHDWDDGSALQILKRAHAALEPKGRLYVLEMVLPQDQPDGGLLDLNLLVTTGGRERTLDHWTRLFDRSGLTRVARVPLHPWVEIQVLEAT